MIKVIRGTIKANGKSHGPEDIVEGLSEQDEASLIEDGYAEAVESDESDEADDVPLEEKTPADLLKMAKALKIEGVSKKTPAEELIELIKAAQGKNN